ncbi:hypothetical protein [Elizabethkingia anophelis]|uniref:HEPN domain-containing protein n=1 Tax=Elizabethkingia anophelis TaxID=1117645 RepID=A0A494JAC1_9FLAO|nr:hypothetical protein [Elizabethkingia anophelis]AQX51315.1 hypothetical protein AYC66_11780 [Elizabethkingia anophelis]MCT4196699.1 hypothetical protein [Elizabethkingia anophelis]MCT4225357.1 hypothetical protein [Elizabethkingia anophelis]MCT4306948.1 hypothetical protein [Elizabethkingia anophelis]MDV2472707.1 hypothetical protein [Elizabethkingia anophelis]
MKKKIHHNLLYLSALGFYNTGIKIAQSLSNTKNSEEYFEKSPVAAMNLSFSTELLLKLLHQISSEQPSIQGHKLDILFNSLPENEKIQLKRKYLLKKEKNLHPYKISFNSYDNNPEDSQDKNNITELTLEQLLEIHSDSFIKWRYIFEISDEYYSYEFNFNLINNFAEAIIDRIKELISIEKN